MGKIGLSQSIPTPISIENGGTNARNRQTGFFNLAYIGGEPVKSGEDTAVNWANLGNGIAYYHSTQLNGQPGEYGMLINITIYTLVFQIFLTGPSIWHRYGATHLDDINMPEFVQIAFVK